VTDKSEQQASFEAILEKHGIDACHFDEIRAVFYWDEIEKIQNGTSEIPGNLSADERTTALLKLASKGAVLRAIAEYSDAFKVSQAEATEMIHRGYVAADKINPSKCTGPSV